MGLGPFLVARLGADAIVPTIVGTNIYDTSAVQDTQPPFIVFEEFDGMRYSGMGSDADICDARLRLHLWAFDPPTRDALALAVRHSLQRYSGNAYGGTQIDDIFIEPGGPSFYDTTLHAWHVVRDFRVIYRET